MVLLAEISPALKKSAVERAALPRVSALAPSAKRSGLIPKICMSPHLSAMRKIIFPKIPNRRRHGRNYLPTRELMLGSWRSARKPTVIGSACKAAASFITMPAKIGGAALECQKICQRGSRVGRTPKFFIFLICHMTHVSGASATRTATVGGLWK